MDGRDGHSHSPDRALPPRTGNGIAIEIRSDGNDGLGRVRIHNPRNVRIAAALDGKPLHDALSQLPLLMPVCGMAHAAALLTAAETALGVPETPVRTALRNAVVETERATALAWRVLVDWAVLVEGAPRLGALREFRDTAARLKNALTGAGRWAVIGGTDTASDRDAARRHARQLAGHVAALFPEHPGRPDRLLDRIRTGRSIPARIVAEAIAIYETTRDAHHLPLCAELDLRSVATALARHEGFGAEPVDADGRPAEVGSLAETYAPDGGETRLGAGPTTAARLLAQAIDLAGLPGRLDAAIARVGAEPAALVDWSRSGEGVAVVATSRGPLAYRVAVDGPRLLAVQSVAPTEWNFHPRGPCAATLERHLERPFSLRAARLAVQSFDPCVPFTVSQFSGRGGGDA